MVKKETVKDKTKKLIQSETGIVFVIISAMITIIVNAINYLLVYGYRSYIGIGNIHINLVDFKLSNLELIAVIIFYTIILLFFEYVIKQVIRNGLFSILTMCVHLSSLFINLSVYSFLIVFGTVNNDVLTYLISLVIMLILQIFSIDVLIHLKDRKFIDEDKIVLFLMYFIDLVPIIGLFGIDLNFALLYIVFLVFTCEVLFLFYRYINKKSIQINSKKKKAIQKSRSAISISSILMFISVFVFIALSCKLTIDIGNDYAANKLENLIAVKGEEMYFCLYTDNDEIIGIPASFIHKEGNKYIKLQSKNFRYISKTEDYMFYMENSKLIK